MDEKLKDDTKPVQKDDHKPMLTGFEDRKTSNSKWPRTLIVAICIAIMCMAAYGLGRAASEPVQADCSGSINTTITEQRAICEQALVDQQNYIVSVVDKNLGDICQKYALQVAAGVVNGT